MTLTVVVLVVGAVVVLAVARVIVSVHRRLAEWRRTFLVAGALAPVAVIVGLLSGGVPSSGPLGLLLLVAAGAAGVITWVRRGRSAAIVSRWGRRARRTSGVATSIEILRVGSAWAMRRRARVVRPSLARLSWRELRRVPPTEYAVRLLRVGRLTVWSSVEDVVTILGGPRTGKTGWMAGAIIDAPGAAVVTSTRLDLMLHTRPLRETHRGPVLVFNPGGLGGTHPETGEPQLPSTVGFDPLTGCADPVVALERAVDMIPEARGSDDRAYWVGQARRVFAAHLHAAALGRLTMHHVLGWIADPDESAKDVRALLTMSQQPAFAKDVQQFSTTNARTRSSITSGIMPALQWLSSPAAVAAARVPAGAAPFDVRDLVIGRGTLYLLGRDETHTAPLMAALVGYICREARRIASAMPGGRIDPPLTLALDEAGRAAPVPLDDWTGDAGGSGITILAAFQSRADITSRWGTDGAAKILNNSGAVLLYGGTKDEADLRVWAELAGDRDETVKTRDGHGQVTSRSVRQAKVLPPARLSNLPGGRAVLFRRAMAPVIGRTQMAWNRADVREAARRARFELTLDTAWRATAIAWAGGEVVEAAEQLARGAQSTSVEPKREPA